MLATTELVLAALRWNPTVRGILFPLIMFVILCGGTYLILATNMGNRVGFLVAVAGLTGWMFLMSIAWMMYAIGLQGRFNVWHVEETITGEKNLVNAIYTPAQDLADGKSTTWNAIAEGVPQRGDAQAVTDNHLGASGIKLFGGSAEYTTVGAWQRGGEKFPLFYEKEKGDNNLFRKGLHGFADMFAFKHTPNHFVIQVQAVVKEDVVRNGQTLQEVVRNEDGTPKIDTTKPVVSTLLVRDLGSKRLPGFVLFLSSGTLLLILCMVLHYRDKQVMAEMKALPSGKKR
jgi:hypothetical protein